MSKIIQDLNYGIDRNQNRHEQLHGLLHESMLRTKIFMFQWLHTITVPYEIYLCIFKFYNWIPFLNNEQIAVRHENLLCKSRFNHKTLNCRWNIFSWQCAIQSVLNLSVQYVLKHNEYERKYILPSGLHVLNRQSTYHNKIINFVSET